MVVLGQRSFFSGKSGCIREKWFGSGKVVVFGQKLFH